eukprot:scaffold7328_cov314-Pinguiococcus_pyrenoidosus.AAC.86
MLERMVRSIQRLAAEARQDPHQEVGGPVDVCRLARGQRSRRVLRSISSLFRSPGALHPVTCFLADAPNRKERTLETIPGGAHVCHGDDAVKIRHAKLVVAGDEHVLGGLPKRADAVHVRGRAVPCVLCGGQNE